MGMVLLAHTDFSHYCTHEGLKRARVYIYFPLSRAFSCTRISKRALAECSSHVTSLPESAVDLTTPNVVVFLDFVLISVILKSSRN